MELDAESGKSPFAPVARETAQLCQHPQCAHCMIERGQLPSGYALSLSNPKPCPPCIHAEALESGAFL